MQRKLASIRRIRRIDPIPGADNIECATVDGWELVVKKGEFSPNDLCCYFEIDSFLPNEPRYEFLKHLKTHQGRQGYRLKTIKLRGQVSQGLALPLSTFPEITTPLELDDVTELLNIIKYDNQLIDNAPGLRTGNLAGKFPHFIPKTDQERIQNLTDWFSKYPHVQWEETLKLDGSSCTMYKTPRTPSLWERIKSFFGCSYKPYHFGVCSRNLEIKPFDNYSATFSNDSKESEFKQSNFWYVAKKYEVERFLPIGYAIQGELIGPKIQANHEKVTDLDFFVFDIYDIDAQSYLTPHNRHEFMAQYLPFVKHVPIINYVTQIFDECPSVKELLERVKGPSMNPGTISEGRVYKSVDGTKSFKCINNDYLIKCEE